MKGEVDSTAGTTRELLGMHCENAEGNRLHQQAAALNLGSLHHEWSGSFQAVQLDRARLRGRIDRYDDLLSLGRTKIDEGIGVRFCVNGLKICTIGERGMVAAQFQQ